MVVSGLDVNADQIGPCLCERLHIPVWLGKHQVSIEKQTDSPAPERGECFGTEREVRHEMSIHDIDVQPLEFQICNLPGAESQVGMVVGQERRCENGTMHGYQTS